MRVRSRLTLDAEALTATAQAFVGQYAATVEGVRRGVARQRVEEAAALAPIGLRRAGFRSGSWLSLLVVRLGLARSGITTEQLGEVAAPRWSQVLRLVVAAALDELDRRAAEGVAAAASLLEAADHPEDAVPSDPMAERAPPDDAVRTLLVPHAPPSLPGRLHLTEAALARAA